MTFEELLKDPIFELPLSQPADKSFIVFIEEFFDSFIEKINQLDDGVVSFEQMNIHSDFIKNTQQLVISGLIETIKEYYNGKPYKAYAKLDRTLRNDVKDLFQVIKQKKYAPDEDFYRIRLTEENYLLEAKELFHIPFEFRNKVTTQRYSIPGFPSLYVGRTIYVCWEELKRPAISNFQAVKLKNVKSLCLLDLTPPNISENFYRDELYKYFMTFPLIACCSVKVKNYSDTFKPEYIVPQLLLQWVRDNQELDGIMYRSTHLSQELNKQNGELANVVLPVKENRSSGHCSHLKSIFEITHPISWSLHQFALGHKDTPYMVKTADKLNAKIPKLELIRGKKYPYHNSILGKLEYYLEEMKTYKIKD